MADETKRVHNQGLLRFTHKDNLNNNEILGVIARSPATAGRRANLHWTHKWECCRK